jgi:hypothetical protein
MTMSTCAATKTAAAALFVLASGTSAMAMADTTVDARYGLFGWSAGGGLELATTLSDRTSARLVLSNTDRNYTDTYSDVDYHLNYKLRTAGLLLDWRPGGGVFHLTGGLLYNDRQSMVGEATGHVTVNGTDYSNANVKATVTWDKRVLPFVGLGWGNHGTGSKGFAWSVDAGVGFGGNINVKITDSTGTVSQSDLNAQQDSTKDDLDFLRRQPMISFGLGWTF